MQLKEITIIIADFSDYLMVILALLSFLTVRKSAFFRLFSFYCITIALIYISSTITANYNISNGYLYHALGLLEIIFTYLLYKEIGLKSYWKGILFFFIGIYLLDTGYFVFSGENIISNFGLSISMLFVLILGIQFLWRLYKEGLTNNVVNYPYFYISAGFTFYGAASFFAYLMINRFLPSKTPEDYFYYSWLIVSFSIYIKFIFLSIGVLKARKHG